VRTRTLIVLDDKDDVISRVAHDARRLLVVTLANSPVAHVVLTGGTVGIGVLNFLGDTEATVPHDERVDWSRVHLWWGDERWVPAGHADRNDAQAEAGFLSRLAFTPSHIHRMPASDSGLSLEEAAVRYAHELALVFEPVSSVGADATKAPEVAFDLVFLGVGPDAHVASLFPGRSEGLTRETGVIPVRDSPKPPPERLSLTLAAINSSTSVWLVAAGSDKADALNLAVSNEEFLRAPSSAVFGTRETRIYCDETARPRQAGEN
jgi:6-phosphogluconolactonase